MNQVIHRLLSSAALVVWGTVMVWMYFGGRIDNYLAPEYRIFTAIAGIVLVCLAVILLILPESVRVDELAGCANSLTQTVPGHVGVVLVVVAPLLIAFAWSPSEFGAAMVRNRGYVESISELPGRLMPLPEPALPGEEASGDMMMPADYLVRNDQGQIVAEPIDLLYASMEESLRPDFEDKEVELIGQVMPDDEGNPDGNRFKLIRMMMMCCAADARPVALTVQSPMQPPVGEMGWVKVTGKATFPVENGRRIPLVTDAIVLPTEPPEELFIYQ